MNEDKLAVVFPGQGSQRTGMGKDFYEHAGVARRTFEEASDVLGWDVSEMCFCDTEKLHLTQYSQPCILTTEIAMYRTIQSEFEFSPSFFGGHSLGEYTALVAAGAISLQNALRVVQSRGELMQKASPMGTGGMSAVIGENVSTDFVRESLDDLPVDIANVNSAQQIVISGQTDSLDIAAKRIAQASPSGEALRFVSLDVSAPFHSRFMSSMKDLFQDVLDRIAEFIDAENAEKVTSNYTGFFHSGSSREVIDKLVQQISSTVKWQDNMRILSQKASSIYEIGPNRPLRKFFQSIGIRCSSITTFSAAVREFQNRRADDTV